MNITKYALERYKITWLITCMIIVIGLFDMLHHPSQEDPLTPFRLATVNTFYPGMSPLRVEQLITKKLEDQIREIPNIDKITSTSLAGQSRINVYLKDKVTDIKKVWHELRNKISDIKHELPVGSKGPFINDDYGQIYGINVAITSDGFSMKDLEEISDDIKLQLFKVPGVKSVDIQGIQKEAIYLNISNARLARYGVSPYQIIEELQQQNIIAPVGTVSIANKDLLIESTGNLTNEKNINDIYIKLPNNKGLIKMSNIVEVNRTYIKPQTKKVFLIISLQYYYPYQCHKMLI